MRPEVRRESGIGGGLVRLSVGGAQPADNHLVVTNQCTFRAGAVEKRFDVVFVVNGLPLVIGEAKTPTRNAVTWTACWANSRSSWGA